MPGPIRGTGKKKKLLQNPWKFVCVCVLQRVYILSSKVIKIHPVFLADEFSISENMQNANFTKMWP